MAVNPPPHGPTLLGFDVRGCFAGNEGALRISCFSGISSIIISFGGFRAEISPH
jgi:hypothetical protein